MRVQFTIPGTPRGKARARSTARIINGRAIVTVYSDPEMVKAEREIARLYRIAAGARKVISGPVKINLVAVFEMPESWPRKIQNMLGPETIWHRGRPDLDNIEKLICDALNKVAWVDDGQIAVVTKGKRYGSPERVEVTIEAMPQHPDAIPPAQRALEARVAKEGWDAVLSKPQTAPKPALPDRLAKADYTKTRTHR